MITLSLCMIVRDEELVLDRCLRSVQDIADEIIIVDTGSQDRTKEIALRYTSQVFDFTWIDDFSAARNFAFSKATMEFCMWMDADDVISKADHEKLLVLKQNLSASDADVVMMKYAIAFDRDNHPTFSYYRERWIKRGPCAVWKGKVHEAITPFGIVIHNEVQIEHRKEKKSDNNRNKNIYEAMIQHGEVLDARELFYYARELMYHSQWMKAIETFDMFLQRSDGWVENKLDACRQKCHCYRAMGQRENALKSLLNALVFKVPNAELCCDLGEHYMDEKQWDQAIFWYETALRCKKVSESGAFIQEDCYYYFPCIQLCVCYDHIGNVSKASRYNDLAAFWNPDSPAVRWNRTYFEKKKQEQST